MSDLTERQEEALETLGAIGLADSVSSLLYFEAEGFSKFTVKDLIDLLLVKIHTYRAENREEG